MRTLHFWLQFVLMYNITCIQLQPFKSFKILELLKRRTILPWGERGRRGRKGQKREKKTQSEEDQRNGDEKEIGKRTNYNDDGWLCSHWPYLAMTLYLSSRGSRSLSLQPWLPLMLLLALTLALHSPIHESLSSSSLKRVRRHFQYPIEFLVSYLLVSFMLLQSRQLADINRRSFIYNLQHWNRENEKRYFKRKRGGEWWRKTREL